MTAPIRVLFEEREAGNSVQDTLKAGGSVIAVFKMANDSVKTMRQWRRCFLSALTLERESTLGAQRVSLCSVMLIPLFAIVEVTLESCAAAAWSGFDRFLRVY